MITALEAAVRGLEEFVVVLDAPAPAGAVMVCSGGIATDADAPPLLCLTRDMAVGYWASAIAVHILGHVIEGEVEPRDLCLRWAEEPGIYRYAMTMQHPSGHRIAAERFAVVCRVWIGSLEDGQRLPPERTVKRAIER